MTTEIKVLDHGLLRLVDNMGSDLSIVRNARVSYDAAWRAGEDSGSDSRLIGYLMANGHNTPFESCVVTFEVKAPIFVFRQWHRHRTQSYNELSARYRQLPEEFYVPDAGQITQQSTDNKQMRTDQVIQHAEVARDLIRRNNTRAFDTYRELLQLGAPRELARSVLPVGTYSHMFATANLHNWYRFLGERLHPHAQYEIRVYAEAILSILEALYPVATAAFKKTLT
jgi:thymidylate synthase (FAD)